jgi:hypothetical protein
VSISDAQRLALPQAGFVATVPHGMPGRRLASQPAITPTYLAFLGRIAPEKGPDHAIRIARACGIPLRIAAKVDKADQHYFDAVIRPAAGSFEDEIMARCLARHFALAFRSTIKLVRASREFNRILAFSVAAESMSA